MTPARAERDPNAEKTGSVARAFAGDLDLTERRFRADESVLRAANPDLTNAELAVVRREVGIGRRPRVDPRFALLARTSTRWTSMIIALLGVIGVVAAVLGAPGVLLAIGVVLVVAGLAGLALGLVRQPAIAGVEVVAEKIGWTWADQRLRTALRSVQTVLGSRAIAEGRIDAPAIRLTLTDQVADLRQRTALINDLEAEVRALPRSERRELTRGLNDAKQALRDQVRLLSQYAQQVRQLDIHLSHIDAVSTKDELSDRMAELTAQSAADPLRKEDVQRHAADAQVAAEALMESLRDTWSDLTSVERVRGVDLGSLFSKVTGLLRRP